MRVFLPVIRADEVSMGSGEEVAGYSPQLIGEGKTVVVTGGAGFIGSHLVRRLLSEGHRVIVVDDFSSGREENLPRSESLDVLRLDLTAESTYGILSCMCPRPDSLIHLAANPSVTDSIRNPQLSHSINLAVPISVFDWCGKSGVPHVVFASTAAVYGNTHSLPVRESQKVLPLSPYAIDKLAGESYLEFFSRTYGFTAHALRFMNVYGPGQSAAYAGVLSQFLECLTSGRKPVIFGDGTQTRDFVHVDDVVEAVVSSLDCRSKSFSVLNIGTGTPYSLNDILDILGKWYECAPVYSDFRDGEVRHSYADITKARSELNWNPRVSLEAGLLSMVRLKVPSLSVPYLD